MNLAVRKKHYKKYLHPVTGIVFCALVSAVSAESYTLPMPPDLLSQRVELLEPEGELSLTEALSLALIESYQQLQMSKVGIKLMREDVLPSAKEVLSAAKNAYRLGEIGSLDLLDAQRTSFQSGRQHIEALADFQINIARIERLIGGALSPISNRITE